MNLISLKMQCYIYRWLWSCLDQWDHVKLIFNTGYESDKSLTITFYLHLMFLKYVTSNRTVLSHSCIRVFTYIPYITDCSIPMMIPQWIKKPYLLDDTRLQLKSDMKCSHCIRFNYCKLYMDVLVMCIVKNTIIHSNTSIDSLMKFQDF